MMGGSCEKISSFGNLKHFRKENQPAGAADRCLDCAVEATCPYSAKMFYLGKVAEGNLEWPTNVLTPVVNEENVTEALRNGPYGRCVYACDNDVVDHQVVNMQFANGATASMTMTAFNEGGHRQTRIFGTRGEINTDSETIRIYDFLTKKTRTVDTAAGDASLLGGAWRRRLRSDAKLCQGPQRGRSQLDSFRWHGIVTQSSNGVLRRRSPPQRYCCRVAHRHGLIRQGGVAFE